MYPGDMDMVVVIVTVIGQFGNGGRFGTLGKVGRWVVRLKVWCSMRDMSVDVIELRFVRVSRASMCVSGNRIGIDELGRKLYALPCRLGRIREGRIASNWPCSLASIPPTRVADRVTRSAILRGLPLSR